jgi:reverse gyrase
MHLVARSRLLYSSIKMSSQNTVHSAANGLVFDLVLKSDKHLAGVDMNSKLVAFNTLYKPIYDFIKEKFDEHRMNNDNKTGGELPTPFFVGLSAPQVGLIRE